MLEVVSLFFVCLVTHILDCYVFSKLVNEKFKISILNIIILIVLTVVDYSTSVQTTTTLKFIIANLITFIVLKLIFNKSISRTLMGTMFTYIGYIVSELIYAIIAMGIFQIDSKFVFESVFGIISSNLIIFIIYIFIFNIRIIRMYIEKIIKWYDDRKIFKILSLSIISFLACYIFIYQISFDSYDGFNDLILLLIFLTISIILITSYFNEKSNNNKLTIEYGQLLEYVKDYEKEVVEKGKKQHEYKNQLIVINDMIPKNNKKLKKYIEDKLEIEKNIKDNVWLEKLTNLPSGGIKGLVYYKLKQMIEKNIDVYVEVDNELSDKKKWFNIEKYLEDYTRILGVYLDNAIEAANESKDKQIIIEFKESNENIEFILSNTYVGKINYDSIDKEKFSTKGKGRGYGLSLVKDIIEKNKLLSQSREINGKFFVQKLTIKK